jgi:riboflavin kinase / FMN adenylyltransferase
MKVLSWEELRGGSLAGLPFAATIGVFDGLHIGHRELIARILGKEGLSSLVLTFAENPKRILSPSTYHGELSTLDQKLDLLESMGADSCALIDFSGDFSKLPGRHFLSMLRESGEFRFFAVGSEFRCGRGLDTDAEDIGLFCEGHSIGFESIKAVHWAGQPVSSSRIRRAVIEGRLEDAASMLGRPYEIDLRDSGRFSSGGAKPEGLQLSPPPGAYEAALVHAASSGEPERTIEARVDAEGRWSTPGGAPVVGEAAGGEGRGKPIGLRPIRLVSRG